MKITLSRVPSNLYPRLQNTLENIPEEILYYKQYSNLRHPLAIFNVSSSNVFDSFTNIMRSHHASLTSKKSKNENYEKKVFDHHKELLASIASFKESGFFIIKTLLKDNNNIDDRNINTWIDKYLKSQNDIFIKKEILNLRQKINKYWSKHLLINNLIKHHHAKYSGFGISGTHFTSIGYFIEGIVEGETAVPHKDVHDKFDGKYTAISFNKDIIYLLVSFYAVCELFDRTIKIIIKHLHGIDIQNYLKTDVNLQIEDILKRAASYERYYFPDEIKEKLPEVYIPNNNEIILSDSSKKYSKMYGTGKFHFSSISDGVTRGFGLLYY